jgi:predicted secreted protein
MNYHTIVTLAVAAIIVDTIGGYILLLTKSGKTIREWYSKFTIGAYSMDIASLTIGTYLATLLTPNFYMQLFYVIIIGLIHDTSFALFLNSINTKSSKILEFFKDYAKEYGKKILLVDALMLVSTLLVSNYLFNTFSNVNIIFLGVVTFYFGLLMVYSF